MLQLANKAKGIEKFQQMDLQEWIKNLATSGQPAYTITLATWVDIVKQCGKFFENLVILSSTAIR